MIYMIYIYIDEVNMDYLEKLTNFTDNYQKLL